MFAICGCIVVVVVVGFSLPVVVNYSMERRSEAGRGRRVGEARRMGGGEARRGRKASVKETMKNDMKKNVQLNAVEKKHNRTGDSRIMKGRERRTRGGGGEGQCRGRA